MAPKQILGDYLKRQEACWDARLPSRLPYVVRLDGRGFHRWVKQTGRDGAAVLRHVFRVDESIPVFAEDADWLGARLRGA